MLSINQVDEQLRRVGCNFRFWGRPEVRELCSILIPGETIAQAVNGFYENGFALLCITDHRILLIDKKTFYLTLEDIRFDMISGIDFSSQMLDGTIHIITPSRTMKFTSWNHARLRTILNYAQQRISEIRQHYTQRQFQPQYQVQYDFQPQQQPQQQFMGSTNAPLVGEMAMQSSAQYVAPAMPLNPYLSSPLTMRKRRVPKFY